MRKLVIAVLLALAASSSLRAEKKKPDVVKLEISAEGETVNIEAYLPGQAKPQKFSITKEDLPNGGKLPMTS
jgi:predicted component of type VI protein secretion system